MNDVDYAMMCLLGFKECMIISEYRRRCRSLGTLIFESPYRHVGRRILQCPRRINDDFTTIFYQLLGGSAVIL